MDIKSLKVLVNDGRQIGLVFPHQLHKSSPLVTSNLPLLVIEEYLFFNQYTFHKQKLAYHRAAMQYYRDFLEKKGCRAVVVESNNEASDIRKLIPMLAETGVTQIQYIDPTDDWLAKRLENSSRNCGIELKRFSSRLFLTDIGECAKFFNGRQKFYQKDFYLFQRKRLGLLLEADGKPIGGKWVFDAENRKKYPTTSEPPGYSMPSETKWWNEAVDYVYSQFPENPGSIGFQYYPVTHETAKHALNAFLKERFKEFGDYQDAIVADHSFMHHSVLSPMINTGLLTPEDVIESTVAFASENDIPINSLEGFIRQIVGWREFIRAVYELAGNEERTKNFWGFTRKIPQTFWTGKTGIPPIDTTIHKVLETGYCHHIERLMVLGNFMLLCEFDPDDVYRWFMELFIDAYDWVMVPNVYGMSQFADGGIMSTKPYLSGSNYLKKMSDYPKGDWQQIWDALFWRFMHVHRDFFEQNPRLGMLLRTWDRFNPEKQNNLLKHANDYLQSLDR